VDLALDAAGIGRWDVDLITGQIDRSARHAQVLGHATGRASTQGALFEYVIPEDRPAAEQEFQKAVSSGGVCEFEGRVKQPDGSIRWVWCCGKVLQDNEGRPVRFLGSSRDITDRKTAGQRLQTQLERLNLLGQITRAIGERQDLRSIFQVVIRSLEDGLPIDFGCVCLYDAQAAEVTVTCVGVRSEALLWNWP
jgi:PAS domain S-box-containing protein